MTRNRHPGGIFQLHRHLEQVDPLEFFRTYSRKRNSSRPPLFNPAPLLRVRRGRTLWHMCSNVVGREFHQ